MSPSQDSAAASGPTLIVGLGAFGAEVLDRLRQAGIGGPAPVHQRRILIALEPQEERAEQLRTLLTKAQSLLGLEAAVRGEPGDARRPSLDVFIVADLADPAVAQCLPGLVSDAGRAMLQRFSNIFPGHDLPNLLLCPVVALLGMRTGGNGDIVRRGLVELEQHAGQVSFRSGGASPLARVFVVEQQTSHYELKPSEVASTVVAFLSLVVGTELRRQEPLRSFLRSPVGHVREKRLFASFGCATLELNLKRYCETRAAAELVESIRAASAAAVGEQAIQADRLVPEVQQIADTVRQPDTDEDLIALLRAHTPRIDFPEIARRDTPEQIRDIDYGWGWFDALNAAVESQVTRLDEREMDEITRVADERGLKAVRTLEQQVQKALTAAERDGPHGWANALRLAERVRDRAQRQLRKLESSLRAEEMPAFPKADAVESAFRSLREEAGLRPRRYRMRFFGALAAPIGATMLHVLPKWIWVALLTKQVPILSPLEVTMAVDVGWGRFALDRPYSFFWMMLLVGALIQWWLARYWEKRHEALLQTRDDLKSAVNRYLTDEVGQSIRRYYESRLHFTFNAWALRALRRVADLAQRQVLRLSRISAGLDRLGREFETEVSRVERVAEPSDGDLVYRTHLNAELLRRTFEACRPAADLVEHMFADMDREGDDDVPPYLFEEKLRALVAPHIEPSHETMARLAGPVLVGFVEKRHGRLAVPLEVHGIDERTAAQRFVFAPPWAEDLLAGLRERLTTLPEVLIHSDRDRLHMITLQAALTRESITLPEPKRKKEPSA